ncbi:MAG TPA: FAD-dependent oxidoreductase [Thermoanaerobaculia bacterium]|nr:FAD-dependent oxidoreductase [Thermoanaerobaculia bacterium]
MVKPVILTVDDDLEVLAAVERDLRQHYRSDYRILKAVSGREALEAARQLKQRGAPIALFLADERMPEMTGTEFLREALKLYPESRRVLLTAYADTQAAISGINDVGLDHYLLKPWDPPVERLYPVLDDLLSDWRARWRPPFEGIRVAGARSSPKSYAVKEFLSNNQVPYQWIDVDQDAPTRELIQSIGDPGRLPVVFFPDGSHLLAPSNRELAEKIGLQTKARLPFYDLVIVGAGPAGLAAAVYGASEGLRTLLLEQSAPGGQAGTSSRIENYLGFPSGVSGADLARRAATQARRFGAEVLAQEAVSVRREDPYRIVRLADGTDISCYSVILATGVSVRPLQVPGMESLLGIGVYYGAAMTEAATYRGQDVCIVGAGNSAGQGALFFSRYARRVTLLVRGEPFGRSMSRYLVDRIAATPNIEVVTKVEISRVEGTGRLERVVARHVESGEERVFDAAAMFIFIGAKPRTEMVRGFIELDEKDYVLTGPDLPRAGRRPRGWMLERDPYIFETNVPGVFAAGDVRGGSGKRVAAAVGEGSGTVSMVHRYLETV